MEPVTLTNVTKVGKLFRLGAPDSGRYADFAMMSFYFFRVGIAAKSSKGSFNAAADVKQQAATASGTFDITVSPQGQMGFWQGSNLAVQVDLREITKGVVKAADTAHLSGEAAFSVKGTAATPDLHMFFGAPASQAVREADRACCNLRYFSEVVNSFCGGKVEFVLPPAPPPVAAGAPAAPQSPHAQQQVSTPQPPTPQVQQHRPSYEASQLIPQHPMDSGAGQMPPPAHSPSRTGSVQSSAGSSKGTRSSRGFQQTPPKPEPLFPDPPSSMGALRAELGLHSAGPLAGNISMSLGGIRFRDEEDLFDHEYQRRKVIRRAMKMNCERIWEWHVETSQAIVTAEIEAKRNAAINAVLEADYESMWEQMQMRETIDEQARMLRQPLNPAYSEWRYAQDQRLAILIHEICTNQLNAQKMAHELLYQQQYQQQYASQLSPQR